MSRLGLWLADVERAGLLRRTANRPTVAAAMLADVARVAAALPADGMPLATLAAKTLGSAHALDPGTPVATLAVRAAASLGAVMFGFGARPWRMTTADYLEGARLGTTLTRIPPACPWDPMLVQAMARERRAVHEEAVAETLLADLEACVFGN